MAPGEIYLANFPFGAGGGMKLRPVLLLTGPVGSVPEVLVAYISSVLPPQLMLAALLFVLEAYFLHLGPTRAAMPFGIIFLVNHPIHGHRKWVT